jgi:hypothetical protein
MPQHILLNGRIRTIKLGLDVDEAIEMLRSKGHKVTVCEKPPATETMEKWVMAGTARATDGCKVEYDGECCHGHKSWFVVMKLV